VYLPNSTGMTPRYARPRATSTASWCAAFVAYALATAPAMAAASPRPVWIFAGLHATESGTPSALLQRAEGSLYRALTGAAPARLEVRVSWPIAKPVQPSAARDLADAHAAFGTGVERYLDLRMEAATKRLQIARDLFQRNLGHMGSADPFVRSSMYLATARLALGDEGGARRDLRALLQRAPDDDLPLSEFPPELADLIDIERDRVKPNFRMELASTPAGAHVTVDGRLRGRTPLTVDRLTLGPHGVRVEAAGSMPWVSTLPAGDGQARQTIRLVPAEADLGARALLRARTADGRGDAMRAAADALAQDARAEAVIIGWLERRGGAATMAVARFDRDRRDFGAIAIESFQPQDLPEAIDRAAGMLTEPDGVPPGPAWRRAFFGRPPSASPLTTINPEKAEGRLVLALGAGAGWAAQVSDPGVAPVLGVVALALSTPAEGGWEAVGLLRAQPLSPRSYLAVAGGRYRPWGPDGRFGVLLGAAFGQIAHTISDTETGQPSVAGSAGLAAGAGLRGPLAGTTWTVDLMAVSLRPDFTVHADLLVGIEFGL